MPSDQSAFHYEQGFAAAQAGDEANPGCPVSPAGRAFMRGYIDGAAAKKVIA